MYIYQTPRHHIPEDSNHYSRCCENGRSYKNWFILEVPSLPGCYAMTTSKYLPMFQRLIVIASSGSSSPTWDSWFAKQHHLGCLGYVGQTEEWINWKKCGHNLYWNLHGGSMKSCETSMEVRCSGLCFQPWTSIIPSSSATYLTIIFGLLWMATVWLLHKKTVGKTVLTEWINIHIYKYFCYKISYTKRYLHFYLETCCFEIASSSMQ